MLYRYFAVDVGDRRVGLAVSDALGITAQGLETYQRTGDDARDGEYIRNYAKKYAPCRIVFGMPRNMDGSYGFASEKVRAFAERVLEGWDGEHDFYDERLSTVAAERALYEAELNWKQRRKVVDRLAAQVILEGYMTLHPVSRALDEKKENAMTDTEKKTPETEEEEIEIVSLVNEDGTEESFWHVLTFPYEGAKYAALVPEDEMDDEEPEVVFVRIDKDEAGDVYVPVENEVLNDELFDEFTSLLDEEEEEE